MARSLQMLILSLSISSVTPSMIGSPQSRSFDLPGNPSIITHVPSAVVGPSRSIIPIPTPTCSLQTVPTNSAAQNFPAWCTCDGLPGSFPTTTPNQYSNATSGSQLCAYSTTPSTTIAPTPFTCNLESATAGFTVPNAWCGCTAGASTSTYSTKFHQTGAAACSFMQDELPAGTIAPSPATCVQATAPPGGPFYNELAWCACHDNAPHPLLIGTPYLPATGNPPAPYAGGCTYTTPPSSTLTPLPIASTSCHQSAVTGSGTTTTFCGCGGAGTTVLYPTGTQGCVFSSVPTSTVTVPSLAGQSCSNGCAYKPDGQTCYFCDKDAETVVSRNTIPLPPHPSHSIPQ